MEQKNIGFDYNFSIISRTKYIIFFFSIKEIKFHQEPSNVYLTIDIPYIFAYQKSDSTKPNK